MRKGKPKVSVIVPNYMHSAYLNKRLQSIDQQSFQDFEVILLDDASIDKSEEILISWSKKKSKFKYFPNKKNSGSTFSQWNKGAEIAEGEYLWIAESDDWADPLLLEKLVLQLDNNPNASIAFGQSMLVNKAGDELHNFNIHYNYIFKNDRWQRAYINNGINEIENYMILHNVIPNASAALLRKSTYEKVGGASKNWKLNGDWMFYIKMLEHGEICYIPDTINYFRVHDDTQRVLANKNGYVYYELLTIIEYIESRHNPSNKLKKRAYLNIASWWVHSIYRQSWTKGKRNENIQINFKLFKRFILIKPIILVHIPYEGAVRLAVLILKFLKLKEPIRRILHKMFPNHFIPHST
jgi:glycosyltransferase involved in cell wall biosynthesis